MHALGKCHTKGSAAGVSDGARESGRCVKCILERKSVPYGQDSGIWFRCACISDFAWRGSLRMRKLVSSGVAKRFIRGRVHILKTFFRIEAGVRAGPLSRIWIP